jgi:L-ascorbate metabolism protein UlaG (beta-lactamase superfamily)
LFGSRDGQGRRGATGGRSFTGVTGVLADGRRDLLASASAASSADRDASTDSAEVRNGPAPPPGGSDRPVGVRITYLGHASLLFETGGETVVTDPVFSNRIGGFFTKRSSPSQFRPEELRGLVGILISHGHHDHLDYRSLKRLGRDRPVLVPWGLSVSLRQRGFEDVRVVRSGDSLALGGWRVAAVPSRHFGGRLPFVYTSGHLGFVLTGPRCIYFAGDTGLDVAMFREIGRQFPIDLAVLPIAGAVFPWFRRNHMNATDALDAFHLLGAGRMLPMHFETFPASFEPATAPRQLLLEEADRRGVRDRVTILAQGASLVLEGSERPTLRPQEPAPGPPSTAPSGSATD